MVKIFTLSFNLVTAVGLATLFWEVSWWWATLACLPLVFIGSELSRRRFAYKNNELRLIAESASYIIAVLAIDHYPHPFWPHWTVWVLVVLGCVVMLPVLATMVACRLRGGRIKV